MSDVCVVGLGKIGLPLACAAARAGHRVRGADISDGVVEQVSAAIEPFPGEAGLAAALTETVGSGMLTATTDTTAAVAESDVVVIVVPLMVDGQAEPEFGAMDAATAAVAAGLRPGTLVSYETTLPVGTTRHRFTSALVQRSGLTAGEELFVVHSPERVFSGRIFEDLRRYPKLLGGIDEASVRRAIDFYDSFLEFDDRPDLNRPNGVWNLGTAEAAELAKLAETTYRDINIAYANELALVADDLGVDVFAVIEACNSQPFSQIHQPGISVGGHCIPVYPHFLMAGATELSLVPVARDLNDSMPFRAVRKVESALGGLKGMRVLVLGLAYRDGVKEHAFSGALSLIAELQRVDAAVLLHDPLYDADEVEAFGVRPFNRGEPADAVILHTAHEEYRSWTASDVPGARVIYDGRAALDEGLWAGVELLRLGSHSHGAI